MKKILWLILPFVVFPPIYYGFYLWARFLYEISLGGFLYFVFAR